MFASAMHGESCKQCKSEQRSVVQLLAIHSAAADLGSPAAITSSSLVGSFANSTDLPLLLPASAACTSSSKCDPAW